MNLSFLPALLSVYLFLLGTGSSVPAQSNEIDRLTEKAEHEYSAGQFSEAERDFRQITRHAPANLFAQMHLGQALFRQEKYSEAVAPYEKARELERTGMKLSLQQHRILIDQLAMAYGISGDLKKSRALLEDAIREDPQYPINYYNLACAFAEDGDKDKVLANLSLAFQHKNQVLRGEKMPDPRADPSFQKYVRDEEFIKLMKQLGFD
jgi:predicted Zn-dependent protease